MEEAMNQISYWYQQYYGDGFFLMMAIASYIYLYAHAKKERKRFLYPIALLVFCVANPLLYFLVFHQIIYWRLFWVIPDAVVIAYAVTKLVQAASKMADKVMVLTMALLFLLFNGSNVYRKGGFTQAQNPEKVDREVKEVCDFMLKLEDAPRCILPRPFLCQARQYSGEIRPMYGRNVLGYILDANEDQWGMYYQIESGQADYDFIFRRASELGYEFVVIYEWNEVEKSVPGVYNYQEAGLIDDYRIYYSGNNLSAAEPAPSEQQDRQ